MNCATCNLSNLSLDKIKEYGSEIRELAFRASDIEDLANIIVRYLFDKFIDDNKNELSLIRLFKTHSYSELSSGLQGNVKEILSGTSVYDEMKCLTMLATAGEKEEWNSKDKSKGHKVIPLLSEKFIMNFPMISNLVKQLGLDIIQVIQPHKDIILDLSKKKYNVFYVYDAVGSSIIPAQDDFVIPNRLKSVLGFGGILPSGNLFTIIMFTKVFVSIEIAELFRTLAIDIKIAMLTFEKKCL